MLITRTPLRISLGGGGTDLPSYYQRFSTVVIAAAINKYVYIGINRTFTNDYFLKYADLERVGDLCDIQHPIIRQALTMHPVGPSLELVSLADIPGGTGLGSSGTFTVGLLRALYGFKREPVSPSNLAEEAAAIEIEHLGRAVGKQDQYIAAYGGLTCFEFSPTAQVGICPLRVSNATLHDLEERLLLFFTGYSRSADSVLEEQRSRTEGEDAAMIENLHEVARLGGRVREALEAGDTAGFAAVMHEHWERKRQRGGTISSPEIDAWYDAGMRNGALGGKLVGAGGGGFLMFYAEDPAGVRRAMEREGLVELRFSFDHDGSTVIVR